MIDDLIKAFRDAGISVPQEIETKASEALRAKYGGCEIYVPKLPKSKTVRRIKDFGTTVPSTYIARDLGMTVRHVQRIRKILKG